MSGRVLVIAATGCLAFASSADAVPPQTTISAGPANGEVTNDNTPTFRFATSQTLTSFQCSIGADAAMTTNACTSPFTSSQLPDGPTTFSVAAANLLGEVDPTPAQRSFRIDTAPPETTITEGPDEGAVINDDAPQFAWGASEEAAFACTADGRAVSSCEQAFAQGASSGPHTFTVAATDRAGNRDPSPAVRTFTVQPRNVTPDLPGCTITGNVIIATQGDDARTGGARRDLIFGLRGNDRLDGASGADCLDGGAGNDQLEGGPATDLLSGGSGNDSLSGGAGNDRLRDSRGRDDFSGGAGDDVISARDATRAGRLGRDSVRCGPGRRDVAVVDRRDRVARDCERVRRRR